MVRTTTSVAEEIQQKTPFRSAEDELTVSLLRTVDMMTQRFQEKLKPYSISPTQYNVLRILRGAGSEGHKCSELGSRMITREPDVTRLLDRMEKNGLITRTRDTVDRRVVMTRVTAKGLKILDELDPEVAGFNARFRSLGEKKVKQLLRLLDEMRAAMRD